MMDRSGATAYVNAKAGGMLQKSFVGPRAIKLFTAHSLTELWSLLFKDELPSVPELMLAKEIEKKARQEFIFQYKKLLSMYSNPDDVCLSLLQYYDYENVKESAALLINNQKDIPEFADISPYNLLKYKVWPNISKMTKDTCFSWYKSVPPINEMQAFDNKLDLQYMRQLWNSINRLPNAEQNPVREIILSDFVMKNILWVLRLKVYYNMNREDIISRLAFENDAKHDNDIFAGPSISIIDKDIHTYTDWADWKYSEFLNSHEEGSVWEVDPCWVENASRKAMNENALKKFNQYPLTAMVLVCWFKIKQNELDTICAAVEALRLGVDEAQVMDFAGVIPERQR